MSKVDFMLLAKNRLRFTQESFAAIQRNTNWSLVDKFVLYDDGSTDGTLEFLQEKAAEMGAELRQTNLGSAVSAQSHFIERSQAEYVAKCDNDAMYPPGWLDVALDVMQRHPELQVLCLEERGIGGAPPYTYSATVEGDGLFVARANMFKGKRPVTPIRKYWGWETWMRQNHAVAGWVKPSIPVFLLDRLPFEPWASLSADYAARGWQRPLGGAIPQYTMAKAHLWDWCGWEAQ